MMLALAYKRLIQLGKVSGAVSFLLAAPYAFVQYLQSQETAQIEQTLNMFKIYNTAPFSGYREKLTKVLVSNKDAINEASKDEQTFEVLQHEILKRENMEAELLLLFDFFDGLAVCVTSNVCDNDATIKLFKPRALDIYVNFYQYMMKQRGKSTSRGFGLGLEAIAKSKLSPQSVWPRL